MPSFKILKHSQVWEPLKNDVLIYTTTRVTRVPTTTALSFYCSESGLLSPGLMICIELDIQSRPLAVYRDTIVKLQQVSLPQNMLLHSFWNCLDIVCWLYWNEICPLVGKLLYYTYESMMSTVWKLQKPVIEKPSTTLGELENSGLLRRWAQRS